MDTKKRSAFNDVVLLAIISNGFWLAIFLVCIGIFNPEIRTLFNSLSSVNIAGGRFELGDRATTLKSYTILSDIFLDIVSNTQNNLKLADLLSEVNAQQLINFTKKYVKEVKKEDLNLMLIRNVAYIANWKGNIWESLSLYEFLLQIAPNDAVLRHDYGYVLLRTDPSKAKKVYADLMRDYPGVASHEFYLGIADIDLKDFKSGFTHLKSAIKAGYEEDGIFNKPEMKSLLEVNPSGYRELKDEYNKLQDQSRQ